MLLGEVSAADVLQELQAHLSVKEHLFQEVMSDRSRQAQEHHRQLTELLHTISSRDQDMKVQLIVRNTLHNGLLAAFFIMFDVFWSLRITASGWVG